MTDHPEPISVRDDVVLRRWRADDAPGVAAACADPELARWIPVPSPYLETDADRYIAQTEAWWESGESYVLCIARADRPIGSISVRPLEDRPSIGYWVAASERGRGTATAAVEALVGWVARELTLRELWIYTDPANEASRRVARRAGFEEQPERVFGPDGRERVAHRRVIRASGSSPRRRPRGGRRVAPP